MLEDLGEASRIVSAAMRLASEHRVIRYLTGITRYSRIQGTVGLLDAAKYVEDVLLQDAGESLEVEMVKFGGTNVPDWVGGPTGWALESAEVRVGSVELRLDAHPTLVAAHSPPTEGWISGEAVIVDRNWWRPEQYSNVKGKVVVSSGNPYLVYRFSVEAGAAAVALYSPSAPEDAVPYKGLFLSRSEAQRWTIPAVTLPRSLVRDIEGKTVSIRVDADVRRDPGFPIVVAWIGDRNRPGPAAVAHICHPTPGANDNASGSAALMEAAMMLSRAVDSGTIAQPEQTIRFIWTAEYTGSSVALLGHLKGLVTEVINLDMVGVEEGGGNGPLRVIASSASVPGRADAALYIASWAASRAMGLRRPLIAPYESGSDHDIAIAYGLPATMMNQWPDEAYHTDMDDVNRISRRQVVMASLSTLTALHMLSRGLPDPNYFRSRLVEEITSMRLVEGDEVGAALAASALAQRLGLQPMAQPPSEWSPQGDERLTSRPPAVASIAYVARRSPDAASRIEEILERSEPMARSAYLYEGLFLMGPQATLKEAVTIMAAEYGTRNVSADLFRQVLQLLADSKIVELG